MNAPLMQDHYTPEDLLRCEPGYELLDGQLVEKPMGAKASVIEVSLAAPIRLFAGKHSLGFVLTGDGAGYELWPNRPRVRKPDVSFIGRGRLPDDVIPDGWVRIPPDFAVEVASLNDNADDLMAKAMEWLGVGVRLVWVVFPKSRTVLVLRPGGIAAWVGAGGELSGEDVLPGFTCLVDEVFAGV